MTITIYHNPACGTSRNVLALIRNSGEEPKLLEYLKTPPTRDELANLIRRMGITPRDLLRRKGTSYDARGLDDPKFTDDDLIALMVEDPLLIDRPIVVTPFGGQTLPAIGSGARHPAESATGRAQQGRWRGRHRCSRTAGSIVACFHVLLLPSQNTFHPAWNLADSHAAFFFEDHSYDDRSPVLRNCLAIWSGRRSGPDCGREDAYSRGGVDLCRAALRRLDQDLDEGQAERLDQL